MGQYIKKIGVLNIAIAKYTLVQKHQGQGEHEDQALCSDRTSGRFRMAGKQSSFRQVSQHHIRPPWRSLLWARSLVFLLRP